MLPRKSQWEPFAGPGTYLENPLRTPDGRGRTDIPPTPVPTDVWTSTLETGESFVVMR